MARQVLSLLALLHAVIPSSALYIEKRDVVISSNLPTNWTYSGCYEDPSPTSPTLSGASYQNNTAMTQESCILFCAKLGYKHSGVEFSYQCFCGNDDLTSVAHTGPNATTSDCSNQCSGNSTEACGGSSRLSMFTSNQTAKIPQTNPGFGLWALYGCYKEGINGRALTTDMVVPGGANNVSVANCVNSCANAGFVLAGVESANQCYCGNAFSNNSIPAVDGFNGCTVACSGNATEFCGGVDHLDMYGFNNTVCNPLISTCPTSSSSTVSSTTTSSSSSTSLPVTTTSSSSVAATTSSSPSIGSSSSSSSGSSSSVSSTSSTNLAAVAAVAAAETTSSSQTSTSTSASATASATPGWYYAGCYVDNIGGRALTQQQFGDAAIMTTELCMSKCKAAGYTVTGLEYYSECYCDTALKTGTALASDPTTCNTPCQGNATEMCGGGNRLSVYMFGIKGASSSSSSSTVSSTATGTATSSSSTASSTAAAWTYLGCYTDAVGSRTLMNPIIGFGGSMTNELCQTQCKAAGYTLAGTEYSGECYCDSAFRNGGGPAPDGSTYCNMACNGDNTKTCGGANRLSMYQFTVPNSGSSSSSVSGSSTSTSSSPASTATAGWVSAGCYNDTVGGRTLMTQIYGNADVMTQELCQNQCKAQGFNISGTEYASECFCDSQFRNYGAPATSGCNMACKGNANEMCGGPDRLNIFTYTIFAVSSSSSSSSSISSTSTSIPVTSTSSTSSSISSSSSSSSSTVSSTSSSSSSTSTLSSTSSSSIFSNSSTSSIPSSTSFSSTTSSTSTLVNSTTSTTSSSASVSPTKAIGWYYLGCYTDNVGARTLANGLQVPGGGNAMTNGACQAMCLSSGYTLSGTEYSGQCYCDTALRNGGGPAPDGEALCNMNCNGNNTQICGGPDRLTTWQYYAGPPGTSSSTTTTSASTSTTSTSPTTLPTGWNYSGCYIDGANGRIMLNQQTDNQQLTIESCVNTCAGLGYSVAGMEYSVQCFCDNFIRNGAALAASQSDCNMNCGGNANEKCGAGGRMSVYNRGNLTVYQPPSTLNTSLPGNWTYKGCLTDAADRRSFPYRITNMVNNNTAFNCLSLCSKFGYPAGGMEFSSECYCGDFSNIVNAGATFSPESDCNMPCSGDPAHLCGGADRISYYAWTGSDLYEWHRPTGPAAGAYEFLIGGPVIPLITAQTIKGKVTFLEKFGTSPANNGTGAYELDVTQIGNYSAAWRTMHVKTDVFCAASLTLPDRQGRQIDIGGWANDATYGLRMYTPDGSPGVAGTNDWQENVNEVALQNGRWYPTAMIMPNGSILVVGGEEGSNGAAVPTLEILPKVGPVLYCDWLARTDPYNLYPYLAVLPTGGIFVAYYNEARILNEVTLETDRVLPNIPAAVNDFDGGRTYPFEGTSVLLPQHAPYSDPLVFMVCGGSTPGPEIALDNCVSIAPQITTPQNWTIERMPSARVISCMTALPDGTYLILNGGQQGRAGFGLAINPNHNAVLYDPSLPVNHRMSVLANTTISRLYHSEAILLQDGRVLVSGSDPEDERFPQEYRVEVFLPPYLTNGTPQPSFTMTNVDWAYGGSYTFTVTSSSSANLKVSLLAADTSTHGNSMGQRTLFPAVSCGGGTCTVTAPPNAYICPPGWFQLFLLDNGVPSHSVYVRIGGDPAGLGNWPDYPDFHPLPGVGPV